MRLKFVFSDNSNYELMKSVPEAADIYELQIRVAQLAEQLGFSHYAVSEHQSADISMCTSPSVFMTAVARHTSVIRLSINGYLMPFHNPIRLAQDVAMLDHLSHGRVDFCALSGVQEHEFMRWNLSFDERREMAEEALEIVKKAWTEEIMTYHGKYWKFDDALPWPMPYQKPHPPIWLACASEKTFERAAKENYHIGFGLDSADVTAEKVDFWRRVWKESGHSSPMPHVMYLNTVYVAETDQRAEEEVAPYIGTTGFFSQPVRVERTKIGMVRGTGKPGAATGDHAPERLEVYRGMSTGVDFWIKQGLALIGSPDTVARGLEERQRAIGFDHFWCQFRPGNLPSPLVEKSMRLFAKEVMPAFA